MSKCHYLKTWPGPYEASEAGLKPFEIRKNDRDYKVGDTLVLQCWRPATQEYTGQQLSRKVIFILANEEFGLNPGYVAMAVKPIDQVPYQKLCRVCGEQHTHEGCDLKM